MSDFILPPDLTLRSDNFDLSKHREIVSNFDFGSEPFETEIYDFIVGLDEKRLKEINKEIASLKLFYIGTEDSKDYIGYAYLSKNKWQISPRTVAEEHLHVPYFGITRRGQSMSKGLNFEQRFSNQAAKILLLEMSYMLTEKFRAKEAIKETAKTLAKFMSLCVKRDNCKAKRFWERHGFKEVERIDSKTGEPMFDEDLIYMVRFDAEDHHEEST